MEAWETETHFKELVEQHTIVKGKLSQEEVDDCFDYTYHLKNVDVIFERLGL